MKILAINASYRPKQTTTKLAEKALEGAASAGAQVEMIRLKECKIDYCLNCLKCYKDKESEIAGCAIQDDMDKILEKIQEADGIIFASPVHNGFVSGLLTVFFERMAWRVVVAKGSLRGVILRIGSRLTAKTRAVAMISSAGGMPEKLRKHCDDGTPWVKSNAPLMLHGEWIGDIYIGAHLTKPLETEQDWSNLYFLRKLSDEQLNQAFLLGQKMARKISEGQLKPYTIEDAIGPVVGNLIKIYNYFSPLYKLV